MIKFNGLFQYLICLLFVTPLGCNAETNITNFDTKSVSKKIVETKRSQPLNHNSTHYTGKPHAPINMRYKTRTKKSIKVGELLLYKIYFSASIDADELQVRYKTTSALLIQNPNQQIAFGSQRKAQNNLVELEVIPQQEGLFYIYLSATLHVDGQQQSRSFAIPVQVGEQIEELNTKKSVNMKPGSQPVIRQQQAEPGIISMPALEPSH